jgi:hypothetical protein
LDTIESLIATKDKTAQAMDSLARSLLARLNLLNEAVMPSMPDCANCPAKVANENNVVIGELQEENGSQKKAVSKRLFGNVVVWTAIAAVAFALGYCTAGWKYQKQEQPPVTVRPVTETLEEFAARETERLTADERRTLVAVTEKILTEHFVTPSAMREAFRYERLKAGLTSPAFFAFSDNWAAKVDETAGKTADGRQQTAAEDVEAMRSIYESLLRGLQKRSQETEVRSLEKTLLPSAVCGLPSPPPDSFLLTPTRRQRLFR